MVLRGVATHFSMQLDAAWASLVACSARFVWFRQDFDEFLVLWAPFLDWQLRVFRCLDLVETSVYGKPTLSIFQRNWPCTILNFVQKTVAPGSRAVRLFSAFMMVFPSFLTQIPVSSDKLLTNQKNLVIVEVSLFKKAQAFQKLMVRVGKTLCTKAASKWVSLCPKYLVKFH